MKNLGRNRAFVTLTVADLFETIGTSLFNIILLTYA
ncbi:putative membrane protein [Lactiplantibacillus plantarum]|nr:putative membrane protein [Lactiplantibacillus plantarum]